MDSRVRAIGIVALLVAAPLAGSGCGRGNAGPRRYPVSGRVTFQGAAVPSGTIYFEADASRGNGGPVTVVQIEDGRYDTASTGRPGPVQGPLSVRILGFPKSNANAEIQRPLFPEWTTTVNLDPAAGPHVFDFDVPRAKRP